MSNTLTLYEPPPPDICVGHNPLCKPLDPKARYYVWTWDFEKQEFTPQKGVRCGPYSAFGLRKALRKLQAMGYQVFPREDAVSVLVESDT